MGFFKRRKNAPLSISMYQGDNATPARSPPRRGAKYGVIPLTPDPVEDNPIAASSSSPTIPGEGAAANKKKKKNPNGFFKRKHNQRQSYVTITPDKQDEGSSSQAERAYAPQTSARETTTSPTVVTPSKSLPLPSSSLHRTPPSTRSRGVHNNNNNDDDDENIPALVSPGKYEDLPPSPHNAIKRNLNSIFHENNTNDDEDNAISIGYNDNHHQTEENKKFLQRFRSSWKRSPLKLRQKQTAMRTFLEEHNNTIASTRNEPTDPPSPVPHTIDHSEEGSIPSLITEPDESKIAPMSNAADVARVSASRTAISSDDLVSHPTEQSKAGSSPSPPRPLTLGEKLWSLFQCVEDTTSDGYFSRIKCLELCAPMNGDRRGLRTGGMVEEEEEEEYAFVHQFIHVSVSFLICPWMDKDERRLFPLG
ncbi:hypothetical protein HJC23_013613 [Cyclotella cryptica]|uniref:Uncharacterized protein n=1 Tax=Cyclotella cryptica TaxID=29204 RepID=A0ABD3PQI0_9STRA